MSENNRILLSNAQPTIGASDNEGDSERTPKVCTIAAATLGLFLLTILLSPTPCAAQGAPAEDSPKPKAHEVNQERIAELTEQILAKPFEGQNYRLRALVYARGEAWDEAAADFRKLVEINPASSQIWQQAGVLIVLAEDEAAYRQFCEKMLERFGASENQGDLERLPKVCSLAPRPVGDLDKLKALAEASVDAVAASDRTYWSPYHTRTLALVNYRRKEYAQAIEAITKSDRNNGGGEDRQFGDIEICNRAIEAMCLIRRGMLDEGKEILATATPILHSRFDDLDELYEDEFWHDWLVAKILHDEAQQVIDAGGMGKVKWGDRKKPMASP